MIKIRIIFIFLSFVSYFSHAQDAVEFLGVLKISDTLIVPYRLQMTLNGTKITGYSITDTGGAHETKSYIKGNYIASSNEVYFEEYDIEYTKSNLIDYDFCFIHFNGKVKNFEQTHQIEGEFKGKFSDGVECINGEIKVIRLENVIAKAQKSAKKLKRNKFIPDSVKNKIDFVKIIDDQRLNLVRKDEKIAVFVKDNRVKLEVVDSGKLDGDRITLIFNGKTLLRNYAIKLTPEIFYLELSAQVNELVIKAENLGEIHPNTVKITLFDGEKDINLLTNLGVLEQSSIFLHKL